MRLLSWLMNAWANFQDDHEGPLLATISVLDMPFGFGFVLFLLLTYYIFSGTTTITLGLELSLEICAFLWFAGFLKENGGKIRTIFWNFLNLL